MRPGGPRARRPQAYVVFLLGVLLLGGCVRRWFFEQLPTPLFSEAILPSGIWTRSAEGCGTCHDTIYAEWAESRMGRAFTNRAFQADWKHNQELYACLYCHTPLVEQLPQRVTGLTDINPVTPEAVANPSFDAALQQEGVTCLVCHLDHEAPAPALVGPVPDVLAPHPVRVDPAFSDESLCETCHQIPPPSVSDLSRPISDTVAEWREWQSVTGRTEGCVDCHMPKVERPLVRGGPVRSGRAHTWGGAWDTATLMQGFRVEVTPDAKVFLHNLSGHRLPTGDPARALVVELRAVPASTTSPGATALREQSFWIWREVRLPRMVDLGDTTLLPGERRLLPFATRGAEELSVTVYFDRLAGLPHAAAVTEEPARVLLYSETFPLAP